MGLIDLLKTLQLEIKLFFVFASLVSFVFFLLIRKKEAVANVLMTDPRQFKKLALVMYAWILLTAFAILCSCFAKVVGC